MSQKIRCQSVSKATVGGIISIENIIDSSNLGNLSIINIRNLGINDSIVSAMTIWGVISIIISILSISNTIMSIKNNIRNSMLVIKNDTAV